MKKQPPPIPGGGHPDNRPSLVGVTTQPMRDRSDTVIRPPLAPTGPMATTYEVSLVELGEYIASGLICLREL